MILHKLNSAGGFQQWTDSTIQSSQKEASASKFRALLLQQQGNTYKTTIISNKQTNKPNAVPVIKLLLFF